MLNPLLKWFFPTKPARTVEDLMADFDAQMAENERRRKAARDPFFVRLGEHLTSLSLEVRPAWEALFKHLETTSGATPSTKWLKTSQQLIDAVGSDAFKAAVLVLLPTPDQTSFDGTSDLLRGLVWSASLLNSDEVDVQVGNLAERCFARVRNHGAASRKVGNACAWSLGASTAPHAVAQLTRLKNQVKYAEGKRMVGAALDKVAQVRGVSSEEVEELGVPEFIGLNAQIGRWWPRLTFKGSAPELVWVRDHGKKSASVPAELKREHADAVAATKASFKQLEKLLPAQARRIESFYVSQSTLTVERWRTRYIEHGLVGLVARKLIWSFGERAGLWFDGVLLDADGNRFEPEASTAVRLWHPLNRPPDEVSRFRTLLESMGVTQPFAQVDREIFALDEDELHHAATQRFAGRRLRQPVLQGQCRQLGWQYQLIGEFDSDNSPRKQVPKWELTVELDVDADVRQSASYIFTHVVTGELTFACNGVLREIPKVVLSELMREAQLLATQP